MMGELLPLNICSKGLLVHLSDRLIVLSEGSFISVLSFVENIQHHIKYI